MTVLANDFYNSLIISEYLYISRPSFFLRNIQPGGGFGIFYGISFSNCKNN